MKRFWVFVIICVVALGIGFTVFRFMTREEILYINQTVFEVNRGETKTIEVVKENLKAGHQPKAEISNTSIVEWTDEENFVFKAKNGGTTTITFTSDLETFSPVTVQVTVGDGNSATPFFIKNKDDLASIGQSKVDENEGLTYIYPLSANYKLVADISDLANDNWKPIAEGDDAGFTGTFDFNGHTISNLAITSATGSYAGLFAKIGSDGKVVGANMLNTRITADVAYAGAIAGANFGTIENARIANVSITNGAQNAVVGGVAGLNSGIITKTTVTNRVADYYLRATGAGSCAGGIAGVSQLPALSLNVYIGRCSAKTSVSAEAAVGGIVGKNIAGAIENCYAGTLDEDYVISTSAATFAGGIVGINEYKSFEGDKVARAYVADTYSVMKFGSTTSASQAGAIIGKNINLSGGTDYNIIYGNYYSTEINNSISGIGSDINPNNSQIAKTNNKTISQLKNQDTYFSFIDTDHGGANKYWQFEEGAWTINEEVSLPELAFEVNYIAPRYLYFVSPEAIRDANDFNTKLNSDNPDFSANLPFSLEADIYLKSVEGFVPFDFNGSLDGNGYTIHLEITTPYDTPYTVAALFKTLGSSAKLKNIKVVVEINSILFADHIAAIAAYNNGGSLSNCSATGTITTDRATASKMYIAGLVAENNGYISGSTSSVVVTYEKSPTLVYIGGIAAYSTGSIENCKNAGAITAKNKTEAYVGGVVGWTNGTVVKSSNHGEIIGEVEAVYAYYGGIAGMLAQNAEAKMTYCSSYEPVTGSNVGGLVGISIGAIENCYSSARVTGIHIGGLAYNIKQGTSSNKSYIKNSMTDNSILYGENDNAVVCGVVYQIDVSSDNLCYCEKIFSSCKFQGAGEKWYETTSNVRGVRKGWDSLTPVDWNAFNNCIYVERDGDINRSRGNPTKSWETVTSWEYVQGREGLQDTPVTEEQAKGSDGYDTFRKNNFKNEDWAFETGYPRLLGIAA